MGRKEREIRAYKISANVDLELFHEYKCKLQKTLNFVWDDIYWEECCDFPIMPMVLKDGDLTGILGTEERKELREIENEEARELRKWLREQWCHYHSHYVDGIIKDCRMMLLSWYENYVDGRRTRRCPWIRSTWVRVKATQYTVNGNKIRITIIPRKKYLELEIPGNAWFLPRIHGWRLGEIILKPSEAILTYNKPREAFKPQSYISIDVNKDTIDILIVTKTKALWIRIDWRETIRLNSLYQDLRSKIQSELNHHKPKMKKLLKKYSIRRQNRVSDLLHKLAKFIALLAKELEALIIIEDLEKEAMYNNSNDRNKEIWMRPWKKLLEFISYKAPKVDPIDPRFTTKQCSNCGSLSTTVTNGTVYCRRCGRSIDRQLNATINILTKYLALQELKRRKKGKLRALQTKIRRKMPKVPTKPIVLIVNQMHNYSKVAREILRLLK